MRARVIGPKPFGDVSQAPTPANGYISHHPGLTTRIQVAPPDGSDRLANSFSFSLAKSCRAEGHFVSLTSARDPLLPVSGVRGVAVQGTDRRARVERNESSAQFGGDGMLFSPGGSVCW